MSVFPYFGGKGRVAEEVWARFGRVDNYLEPFGGSLAVSLANPDWQSLKSENLNDFDGFICNFWRSVAFDPEAVTSYADWPVNHLDLSARHAWLVDQSGELTERLRADPGYHDPKIAGWWVWGISQWIGSGWCAPMSGPHSLGQRPHLGDHGMGPHKLGQRPHLGDHGMGGFYDIYRQLSRRLRYARVTCVDWKSLRSSVHSMGVWGVFLDPPYTEESGRDMSLYSNSSEDEGSLGVDVARWAVEIGDSQRVALCGIDGEYQIPDSWDRYYWKTGGYSWASRDRAEVIWFSPQCLPRGAGQIGMFGGGE